MDEPRPFPQMARKAAIKQAEGTFSHPWNRLSQITGAQDCALEAGDFVAFPAPSVAHNPAHRSGEDLVYPMRGESHPNEVGA